MLQLRSRQFEALAAEASAGFLLETVSEWFAIFERVHGKPTALPFDTAWAIAAHVVDQVDGLPQPASGPIHHALVHAVLSAAQAGASGIQLRRALTAFCRSLPSSDAGFMLFDLHCSRDLQEAMP
jgi:hypothetical protein